MGSVVFLFLSIKKYFNYVAMHMRPTFLKREKKCIIINARQGNSIVLIEDQVFFVFFLFLFYFIFFLKNLDILPFPLQVNSLRQKQLYIDQVKDCFVYMAERSKTLGFKLFSLSNYFNTPVMVFQQLYIFCVNKNQNSLLNPLDLSGAL